MIMHQPLRILSESEARLDSFHDVHVHGLHWRRDQFSFLMDAQYILEWIAPIGNSTSYRFLICESRIMFRDVDDLKVSMDWSGAALDTQIDVVRILKSRTTPSGRLQQHYEIEFSDPEGSIMFWSTGYEVRLLGEPVISAVTSIPMSDDA
jgi:hypothetical protein